MSNTTINVPKSSTQETIPDPNNPNFGNYTYPLSLLGHNFTTGAYNIKMTATNAVGTSAVSNIVNFTISPPSIPTNLVGTANGSIVSLSWNVSSPGSGPITSFDISYNSGASPTTLNVPVGSAPIVSGKYTYNLSLQPGTTYTIQVRANNSFGSSNYCNTIQVTTAQQSRAPSVPSDVTGQPNTTSILLEWNVTDPGYPPPVTSFDISYNSGGTTSHATYNNIQQSSSPYFYELTGLQPTTLYHIQINATNSSTLVSAYSTEIQVTTLNRSQNWYGYPNSTTPTYIYTTATTIFFQSISLNPSISGVVPEPNDNWTLGTTGNLYTTYPVNVPLVKDSLTSLTGGVLGSYWQDINGILTTQYPIYIFSSQIIILDSVPSTPVLQDPATDISYNSALLTWTVASDGSSPITKFNIKFSPSDTTQEVLIGSVTNYGNGTFSYTLNNLQQNTIYNLSVNAVNSVGGSLYSNVITIQTLQNTGNWILVNQTSNIIYPDLPTQFIYSNATKILFSSFIINNSITSAQGQDNWVTNANGYLVAIINNTTSPISMPESYSSSNLPQGTTFGNYWQNINGVITTQYPVVFKIGQISN